jgi:AcrR family transcriptional regulator
VAHLTRDPEHPGRPTVRLGRAELAAAKGLDAVTVDAVADHANVSRRTFSNYFAGKEEALLYGERMRFDRLLAEIRGRPSRESAWQALTRSVRVMVEAIEEMDPVWIAQMRLVRRHPALAAHQLAMQSTVERELVDEILVRGCGPEPDLLRARVMAGTFLSALRSAFSVWIDQQERLDLGGVVTAALDIAAERLR